MWIGTEEGGLNMYDPNRFKFKEKFPAISNLENKSARSVKSVHLDSKGRYWIGTDAGLMKLDKDKNLLKWYTHDEKRNSLMVGGVMAVQEMSPTCLLIGSWGGGLQRFYPESEHFFTYAKNDYFKKEADITKLATMVVLNIMKDEKDDYYITSIFDVIDKYDTVNNLFQKIYIEGEWTWNLVNDPENNKIWFGNNKGFFSLDKDKNKLTSYKHDELNENSLLSNVVNYVARDTQGYFMACNR
ncbi:MAG: hypothetical protein HC896_19165 [Bacteroidales bacterium]|nr:hypothetical protein [Bacteroidales bacterium]